MDYSNNFHYLYLKGLIKVNLTVRCRQTSNFQMQDLTLVHLSSQSHVQKIFVVPAKHFLVSCSIFHSYTGCMDLTCLKVPPLKEALHLQNTMTAPRMTVMFLLCSALCRTLHHIENPCLDFQGSNSYGLKIPERSSSPTPSKSPFWEQ